MGWKLGHQHQSTFSWHQVLVKMFPCRFALLHRNTPSRGFLEAGAWLVKFQPSVCYNCSLLFRVLASTETPAEGKVGISGRRRVTTCFSWQQCSVFLLQGIQIKPARVWCAQSWAHPSFSNLASSASEFAAGKSECFLSRSVLVTLDVLHHGPTEQPKMVHRVSNLRNLRFQKPLK